MSITSAHNDYLDPDRYNPPYDDDAPNLTPEQVAEISRIRREVHRLRSECYAVPRKTITPEMLFEGMDGEFACDGEPEDVGVPWQNDEGDWMESIQVVEQGRDAEGKRWFWVLVDSIAGCGDYQPVGGWDEREGEEPTDSVMEGLWFDLCWRDVDYSVGWAEYAMCVAETGCDPLDKCDHPPTVEDAISAANEHIDHLAKLLELFKRG